MTLPEFSTRYPTTIAMAVLAVVLLGYISLERLGTDLLPELHTPVISVDLRAPGKSPWEMEERYTRRLERDIQTISQVKRVYSVTRASQSVVVAEFAWEADMDFALLDVQKRTAVYGADDAISSLDVTREDPQALPVMRVAVLSADGTQDVDDLLGTIETAIKPNLEALDGVASAEVEGGAEKEARVTLDPYLLEAFGMNAAVVARRIQQANLDVSGGMLKDAKRSYQVKGLGRLRSLDDIRDLIVGERRGGTGNGLLRVPVRVSEIGEVALMYEERESISRLNGVECVGLAIYKEADANTVNVVQTARSAIEDLEMDLSGVSFTIVENQARFIELAVNEVKEAAIYGGLLAITVLLLFLRSWAVTATVGLAIPISILATFMLMYFEDLTLNVMSLGGLALGAGMLVDNAIVVIENIYRHLEGGSSAQESASRGASEVGTAILASTLTTVSVFLPIVYLHGLAGELFKEQAWTVAFSLISSLAVALSVVPMIASRVFRRQQALSSLRPYRRFTGFLTAALDRKGMVFTIVILVLVVTATTGRTIDVTFMPREDQGIFHIAFSLPEGTRLELTDGVSERIADVVASVAGDEVAHVYGRIGVDPAQMWNVGEPTGPNRGTMSVLLKEGHRRRVGSIVTALDAYLSELPNVDVKYELHESPLEAVMGTQTAPLVVEVAGEDLDVLRRLTEDLKNRIAQAPGVYNVRSSFQGGQPELDLALRLDVAASFGLTPDDLIGDLERRLSGEDVGEYSEGQRARTIRVGFKEMEMAELSQIRVDTPDGGILTVADVADPRIVEGPREIRRERQRRIGRVTGYVTDGTTLGEAIDQVDAVLATVDMPPGYRLSIGGEERDRAESFGSLQFALILSIILVYMVMASLFESFLHPFTVMLSLPLAGVGVVLGFWLLGEPLSITAFIGVIMLGGIAVNDSIVLVDRINQLRETARSVREAVVSAARDRLRPIMMTSATTVLALLPMAIGLGEGGELRAPMAIAVIGGLVSSTLMTLVVIPVVYELVERVRT
ncbi:TPA: AcrB/AcrD/AcrF family protein [Candidatus Latescibacteria bacterium]|nr:AcrB/AcrD/AcrF family protein [Candidatus Latescibacterota bacterium]